MHRRTSWLLAGAAAAGLVTGLLPTTASAAVTVTTGTVFNDPSGTTAEQDKIRDYLVSLIDDAPAGSSISVSMYTFTDNPVRDALIAAKTRGVSVKVVVDHKSSSTVTDGGEYENLAAGLGTDRTKPSWALDCGQDRGCIGTRVLTTSTGAPDYAINHNKFFLFSHTGGADNVVVQTSANLSTFQRERLFNNAVTIVDKGLYDIYQAYFADHVAYASGAGTGDYYKTPTSATDPAYKTYFFPRKEATGTPKTDPSTDTVKLILDNVDCAAGTEVRIAANLFYREQIATKLVSMKSAGCSVILAHDNDPNGGGEGVNSMGKAVEDIISGKLTQRVECWETPPSGREGNIGLHSKYLLVNGTYDGVAGKKIVWTGSHNYSYQALRQNDETLLKIDNAALHEQYKANHTKLMNYCTGS
ncbi:phospholipase D-like domain-containing protein [Streptomyces sp. NPDC000410]|uniref:phospholipase D-like domain-containing protein n=1 Tax=Streptomyces sp. NPDC000410 TaxID=3154254 RepID=UPI00332460A1